MEFGHKCLVLLSTTNYISSFCWSLFLTPGVAVIFTVTCLIPSSKLQRVLSAAARVVSGTRKYDCGLATLINNELYLLDVPDRVTHKLGLLMHTARLRNTFTPNLHLASSEQWCWSGGMGILTELSLCYSLVLCSISAMHIAQYCTIIMSSSFRLVYWIGLWSHWA